MDQQISSEQWKTLVNAAGAASAYVSSASGGGLEMIKELFSASKFMVETIKESSGSGYGELVEAFLERMKGMSPKEAKADAAQYEARDMESLRAEAKQRVAEGVKIADGFPGGDGFKRWLLDMAREVAKTKTGGILGVGATSEIDDKEQAALDELAALMGI